MNLELVKCPLCSLPMNKYIQEYEPILCIKYACPKCTTYNSLGCCIIPFVIIEDNKIIEYRLTSFIDDIQYKLYSTNMKPLSFMTKYYLNREIEKSEEMFFMRKFTPMPLKYLTDLKSFVFKHVNIANFI